MTAIIGWAIAAGVCGLATLVLALLAIARRRMGLFWLALVLGAAATVFGLVAAYRFADGAYRHVREALEPRTGAEIYTALFGSPEPCVEVTAERDQIVPRLDPSIRLRAKTCPAEMARILAAGAYSVEKVPAARFVGLDGLDSPFAFSQLGDTVLVHQWEMVPGRQWRSIHSNVDSTLAIIEDIVD